MAPNQRIFGVETEYGITCASTVGGEPPLDAESAAEKLFEPLVKAGGSTNMFLRNGGRLYLDVGAHPEYATAESSDLWDLLAQVRAGSEILADLARGTTSSLQAGGVNGRVHLFANNLDSSGNSFGCHENYLLRRRRDFREVADSLIAFFVTRQVVAGAGDVKEGEDGGFHYIFSSRADQMHDALSSATTRARPIINTRDEPLSDSGSFRRLHVIVGDTNVSEPTTALKVGSTDLVLNAVEQGMRFADLRLKDPLKAIRDISGDTTGQARVETVSGQMLTATEIQREIMSRALRSVDLSELSPLYQYVVDLWERGLDAVVAGDWGPVDQELDFAIKKKLLDSYLERTGAELGDPRVARLLLSYHDITDGLAPKLEAASLMVRLTSEEQVAAAKVLPPATRAHLRGQVVAAAEAAGRRLGVDWVNLRVEGMGTEVNLQDPFATEDPRIDALLETLRRQGAPGQ